MASGVLSLSVLVCAVLTVTTASTTLNDDSNYCSCSEESINRRGFPDGFVFGSASAAYQVEGAYNESGKGMSMWDNFTHTYPERIRDGSNGDLAVDSYHLYKEDVKLLKNMAADAYKFSISWSRILPGGAVSKGVNEEGINYYNNLINELLANGIQPWVTLLHLDVPQALQDAYGGFVSPRIVNDFEDFADLLFSRYGDRVKHWITINEPWGLSYLGYTNGTFAPGRCSKWINEACSGGDSATEPYYTTHNQLLAHAAVVKLYREKYQEAQEGMIGVTVNCHWFLPYDDTIGSLKARDRAFDFMLGWVMDPITSGRYPKRMTRRVRDRLPKFTQEQAEMVKGSFDFIGLNYYSGMYAFNIDDSTQSSSSQVSYTTDSGFDLLGDKDGIPIGEKGSINAYYYNYPKGLRLILQYIKLLYNDPVIYVTENGQDEDKDDSVPIAVALKDYKRKKYFFDHLCCLQEAIQQDGANVKGYFAWSLVDNYGWASGYLTRFGLNYVDYGNGAFTRYPKLSAQWLGSIFSPTPEKTQARGVFDQ